MKFVQLIAISGMILFFAACGSKKGSFELINSKSFADQQVIVDGHLARRFKADSADYIREPNDLTKRLEEMVSVAESLRETKSDSTWSSLQKSWEEFQVKEAVLLADTSASSVFALQDWAKLNSQLLKLTSEVRFADALERLIYKSGVPVLSESSVKSIIYTHVDDQIFINLFGASTLNHHHTTGGVIKLVQETNYPESQEIILKCECSDTRFLDVFIRIPEWAVNPTITHGNVKYVAYPGQYSEIMRKWNNGDEFRIVLKN